MIDVLTQIRGYLLKRPTVFALTQKRMWPARVYPPKGYKPDQGPALVFQVRGGALTYENDHVFASVQFKCYGLTEVDANELYIALIADTQPESAVTSVVRNVELEGLGMTLEEPDSEWVYVLCNLNFMVRVTGGI